MDAFVIRGGHHGWIGASLMAALVRRAEPVRVILPPPRAKRRRQTAWFNAPPWKGPPQSCRHWQR